MKISAAELRAQAMSEENLRIAVRTLKECGFVIIEDVVSPDWIDRIRRQCDETLQRYMQTVSSEKRATMERTHTAMFPPICSPFMDAVAIENPFAVQVTEAAIGPDFFCTFYNTNTQWPHSGGQDVAAQSDAGARYRQAHADAVRHLRGPFQRDAAGDIAAILRLWSVGARTPSDPSLDAIGSDGTADEPVFARR